MRVTGRLGLWVAILLSTTGVGALATLSPRLAAPLDQILLNYAAESVAALAVGDENLRHRALVHAYEEAQAAFFQLRKRSYYQLPERYECGPMFLVLSGKLAKLTSTGKATMLELQQMREAGVQIGMGKPPYENFAALERYRDYADLTTGPENTAVGERLREVLLRIESLHFLETAEADRNADLPFAQAQLRQLSLIELQDFVAIESLRFRP